MRKMKCTKSDFTEDDLPATRLQMFFDCYREQFSLIVRIGLCCLLFCLPLLIVWMLRDSYIIVATEALPEQTKENIQAVYFSANIYFGMFEMLATVLFVGLFAGIAQVIRQLCWGEPVFFWDDFKKGLKGNAGRFSVIGIFIAVLRYLFSAISESVLLYLMFGIFLFVLLPIAIWTLLQTLYYRLRWMQVLKNAMLLLVQTAPVTLLLLLGTILPFWAILTFVKLLTVKYLLLILLTVLYVVPCVMAWILFSCDTFDKYINQQSYPEIYRKGLRPTGKEG